MSLMAQPAIAQIGSADAFDPDATDGYVYSAAVQADGKVFVAGNFSSIGGYTLPNDFIRPGFFRLNADGTRDLSFAANIQGGPVECMAVQPDGSLLIGGDFSFANGYSVRNIVRLNADGTLPITGVPPLTVPAFVARPDGHVKSIALLPDGKIIILGTFTSMDSGAVARSHIARLNADGSLDTSFDPPINSGLTCMALQPDGKLIVGGYSSVIGGVSRTVARLTTTGALDPTFVEPGADWLVSGIVVQPDGKVLVAGSFENIGGGSHPGLVRLNSDGTPDSMFSTILNRLASVKTMALQADGCIILGGVFSVVNGTARNNIARVLPGGALDMSFNPSSGGELFGSALQADGRLVVTGTFQHEFEPYGLIGGQQRNRIARLMNDSASELITVSSQTQIVWARGGSSPEAFSVRFELSNDGGLTWSLLGEGSRMAGGWQITGLSLPVTGIVRGIATVPVVSSVGVSSGIVASAKTYAFPPAAEVTTLAPTAIAAASATLNATIDPNGSATSALFQYGLTTAYGSTLPITLTPNDGNAPLSINLTATGLTPHATHHYRVVATNAFGTSYGEDHTFFSNATPNTPALSVSTIAENEPAGTTVGTLGTVADSDGDGITYTLVSGDGDTDNFSFTIVGNTLQTNDAFNFEWQQNYTVRVRATDGFTNGTTEAALSISVNDLLEPPTATTGTAVSIRHSSAALRATVNPNSVETTVQFEYGLTASYGSTANAFLFPPDGTTPQDIEVFIGGLQPSTTYHYRVISSNDEGTGVGLDQTFVTRATSPGDVDLSFNPNVQGGAVQCSATQPDGKILIGGYFTEVNGVARNNVARLNPDGTLDLSFDPGPDNSVNCIAVQPDGKIILGGNFSQVGATVRNNLVRLQSGGAVDGSFTPTVDGGVTALLPSATGETLYISGFFTTVSGQPRGGFARLMANGSLDPTLPNMAPDGQINCMVHFKASSNTIVVGGSFTQIGGHTCHGLALILNDGYMAPGGSLPLDFAEPGTVVTSLARGTSTLVVGGWFSTFGGVAHENLARILTDDRRNPTFGGSFSPPIVDSSFTPSVAGGVNSVAIQSDGKLVVGGNFSGVNGNTSVANLARLNSDGTLDTSFDAGVRAGFFLPTAVTAIALQADGRPLISGMFTHLGGELRPGIARLMNSSASVNFDFSTSGSGFGALMNATWTRSGAAPAVIGGNLEWSTDGGLTWVPHVPVTHEISSAYLIPINPLFSNSFSILSPRLWRVWGYVGGGSQLAVSQTAFGAITEWRTAYFGSSSNTGSGADTADPDHDGVENLAEYAFGLSPIRGVASSPPGPSVEPDGMGGDYFEIRFTQPAYVSGIQYGAEWSATLAGSSWVPVPDIGTLPEHVFRIAITPGTPGFMRLVVTRTP